MERNLEEIKNALYIPKIDSNCNFWMIRTNNGAFYNEYIKERFVSIGWNAINKNMLEQYQHYELKAIISKKYQKEKQPGSPVNKCIRFINEISENDIVLIIGDYEIAFAVIKGYFEHIDNTTTIQEEIKTDELISKNNHRIGSIKCPYIKRRKIEIIRTMRIPDLNPNLYKAYILNRHSLSSLNDYAEFILSACYDVYVFRNIATITFRSNFTKRLRTLDVSGFIYYATKLLCFDTEKNISTKIHLSSPGDILFQIENGVVFIEEHWELFVALALILFGGNIEVASIKTSMPSLKNAIMDLYN